MHTYIHTYIHTYTHTYIYIYIHTHITPHTHTLSFIHSGCKPRYRSSFLFGHSNLNQFVVTLTMAVTVTVTVTMTVAVTVTVTVSVTVDVTVTVTSTMTVTVTMTVALTVEIANTRRHTFICMHMCTYVRGGLVPMGNRFLGPHSLSVLSSHHDECRTKFGDQ
jgi:hypothetical protein